MTTYKDAISRTEAVKIIKNWEAITYNCDSIESSFDMIADNVKALPSLQDQVVELIDKKIAYAEQYYDEATPFLVELLEEIKSLNQ